MDLNINPKMLYGQDYFTLRSNPLTTGVRKYSTLSYSKRFMTGTYSNNNPCLIIKKMGVTSDGYTVREHCRLGKNHYSYSNLCGAMIQCNGWKIPDDYPWSIK